VPPTLLEEAVDPPVRRFLILGAGRIRYLSRRPPPFRIHIAVTTVRLQCALLLTPRFILFVTNRAPPTPRLQRIQRLWGWLRLRFKP
jgi:hypothetical protein